MYIYRRASQRSGKLMTNLLLHKSKSAFKCFLEKQKMKRIDFEIGICFPLILDSLFIFVFGFGIRGAAIATVISQFLSAAYVLLFLEKKAEMKARLLKKKELSGCMENAKNIISLGTAGAIMLLTVLPELKRMEN